MKKHIQRITINQDVRNGKPTIRNMRITVAEVLSLLASGMEEQEILRDYPYLEKEDILACLQYAAQISDRESIIPLAS